MTNERKLIAAAKAGSVDAFTDLVGAYRERLLRFLLTRCTSFADAEDVLQDTLVAAYRYLYSYDSRWRFSTWLYRIAIRNAARQAAPYPVVAERVAELCDEESDPLLHCIAVSETENLWVGARRVLKDEVFVAMWLRYAEDMSVKDIAAALERSESWTKVNLMRGRQALETELADAVRKREAYG